MATPTANTATLPTKGTPNNSMPSSVTTTMSIAATMKYGVILPMITDDGLRGITASCSSVPFSRSLTRPMAATTVPMNIMM